MAENKLLDKTGLDEYTRQMKIFFPLISSIATINDLSLVNGGQNIEIKGEKDVCFFDGEVTGTLSGSVVNGSGTGPIRWRSSSKTFVSQSGTTLYSNFPGGDDYGQGTSTGRQPTVGKLYIDTVGKKFYYWTGSDLVCLTIDTTLYRVVTSLPKASADTVNKIYLVTGAKTATNNAYAEYITIEDGTNYSWEKLGEVGADVDLSQYVTTTYLTNRLANYLTTTSAASTYLKKTDASTTYMDKATYGYSTMTATEIQNAVKAILGS